MSAKAQQRLTKRQQRLSEKGLIKFPSIQQLHFQLKHIQPITDNQVITFNAFDQGDNLFLHGCAGTGKTFISIYLALKEIENGRSRRRKLIIIRTAQSSKDIGFLPGTEKQKLEVYEAPYKAICAELYHRDDAYDILKTKGIIEFHSTSYLRGTTINDAIILVDEVQNQRYQFDIIIAAYPLAQRQLQSLLWKTSMSWFCAHCATGAKQGNVHCWPLSFALGALLPALSAPSWRCVKRARWWARSRGGALKTI